MGLFSAYTLIRAISLAHLTAAYFFLTAPKRIADQNVVFMLGESMQLQHVTSMDKPSESNAFIAVILAFIGIADLTAASLNELAALEYWLANVPVRLFFLFIVTGYTYLFKEDGMFGKGAAGRSGIGEPLQNSLVFAWGFFELAMWFWVGLPWPARRTTRIRKERNALVMINFSPDFVSCGEPIGEDGMPTYIDETNTIDHVVKHIMYIGEKIGYDHVGIGTDYDGIPTVPRGLDDVSSFPDLVKALLEKGVSEKDAGKIVGRNLLRVWHEADRVAAKLQEEISPLLDEIKPLRPGVQSLVDA